MVHTDDTDTNRTALSRRHSMQGQGMVEYALILVLIAVVAIVTLRTLGGNASNAFSNISNSLAR